MDPSWLKEDVSLEIVAPLTSHEGSRSAADLRAVVAQFCVATARRYAKRDIDGKPGDETCCNYYLREVLAAMGCVIPRMKANAHGDWFMKAQATTSWTQVRPWVAREMARAGFPVVALWENPNGPHGHVAIVVPSRDELDRDTTHISQAGLSNFEYGRLTDGFGTRPVTFYVHP